MTFDAKKLIRTSLLLSLAIVFQALGRSYPFASQFIVGPVVNSIFIVCLFINGLSWSVLIAMLTPLLALSLGQLPQPLAPMVPVIALGNIVFLIVFYAIKKRVGKGFILDATGILAASFAKYGCIFFGIKLLMNIIQLVPKAQTAAAKLMGINQFVTALAGGIIGLLLVQALSSRKQLNIKNTF